MKTLEKADNPEKIMKTELVSTYFRFVGHIFSHGIGFILIVAVSSLTKYFTSLINNDDKSSLNSNILGVVINKGSSLFQVGEFATTSPAIR